MLLFLASVLRSREEMFARKEYEKYETINIFKNKTAMKVPFLFSEFCAVLYTLLLLFVTRMVFSYVFLLPYST